MRSQRTKGQTQPAAHMNTSERAEFRQFCRNATDAQIIEIESDERGRAARERAKGDGSDYYATCYEIACAERNERAATAMRE